MRGCSNQVFQAVGNLMESDLRGELRDHDTIGLWTYAGKLNVRVSHPILVRAARRPILSDMEDFLQEQDFAKQARLAKVMPAIKEVVTNSERADRIISIWTAWNPSMGRRLTGRSTTCKSGTAANCVPRISRSSWPWRPVTAFYFTIPSITLAPWRSRTRQSRNLCR